jgi:hypothetical protein
MAFRARGMPTMWRNFLLLPMTRLYLPEKPFPALWLVICLA